MKYFLRYDYMWIRGKSFMFPCDKCGDVDFSNMSISLRESYENCQFLVGMELLSPYVVVESEKDDLKH